MADASSLDALAAELGPQVRRDEPLAPYTALRVGGPADLLVVCESVDGLLEAVRMARRHRVPWRLLGGGCNVLVADAGVRGLVIVNRAAQVFFDGEVVRAEAGGLLAVLSREAVARGLAGLEWAAGLPGTVGGAVVGNAGAFDGDMASVLRCARMWDSDVGVAERPNAWFEFEYRQSRIKRQAGGDQRAVVLDATLALRPSDSSTLGTRASEIIDWRRTRHPSGATMGSTFKNPPSSHAGYLIEETGLRGCRIGGAYISQQHGNFIMNAGDATAADVWTLIKHTRTAVKRAHGATLELEIELVGAWETHEVAQCGGE